MEELGALIGKGHSHISQIEADSLMPGADLLGKLADALGVSADALLSRDAGTDERLVRLMKAVTESHIEDVLGFFETMNTLPPVEQRLVARLVRLSATDYVMKAPKRLKASKTNEPHETIREEA